MTTTSVRQIRVSGRAVARFVIVIVLFLAVPFVAAGTLAWAYVAVYLGSALSSR